MKAERQFKRVEEEARNDPNIIGLFLSGSRGKGFERPDSDYDVYIIVEDREVEEYRKKYPRKLYENMDLMVFSVTEFRGWAAWGSPEWFARYSFAHVLAMIDKTGGIQPILDEKARIPERHREEFIEKSLDGYINFVYRSIKCIRDTDLLAARLEAAYSIPLFFDVIFAIHGGRLRPYYKYLRWELEQFPLDKLVMGAEELIAKIKRILDDADLATQQELLKLVERRLRQEGYGEVFKSWGEDLGWMKTYKAA